MQLDPIKPMLKPPGTKHLKLEYDELLSSFAFKFNLHRFTKNNASYSYDHVCDEEQSQAGAYTRSLQSST